MPIRVRHVVQCDTCHLYLADRKPSLLKTMGSTCEGEFMAMAFTGSHAAEVEAIVRGWSVYPVLCPACVKEVRARLDRGTL